MHTFLNPDSWAFLVAPVLLSRCRHSVVSLCWASNTFSYQLAGVVCPSELSRARGRVSLAYRFCRFRPHDWHQTSLVDIHIFHACAPQTKHGCFQVTSCLSIIHAEGSNDQQDAPDFTAATTNPVAFGYRLAPGSAIDHSCIEAVRAGRRQADGNFPTCRLLSISLMHCKDSCPAQAQALVLSS